MPSFGSNTGYVDDLYQQYLADPQAVSAAWREFFADYPGGGAAAVPRPPAPRVEPIAQAAPPGSGSATATETAIRVTVTAETDVDEQPPRPELTPIRGIAAKIVENMETSLGVPTATTVRTIPVRLLEENRRLINEHQQASAGEKVSFTHLIGYAVVRARSRSTRR